MFDLEEIAKILEKLLPDNMRYMQGKGKISIGYYLPNSQVIGTGFTYTPINTKKDIEAAIINCVENIKKHSKYVGVVDKGVVDV